MPEIKTVEEVVNKKWYMSRTLYINLIAVVVIIVQSSIGVELLPVEYQSIIVALLNMLTRTMTNTNITL